jgi:hypothetical protein
MILFALLRTCREYRWRALAPLAAAVLMLTPEAGRAQQPAARPAARDTSGMPDVQQMMGMFNQMGPMYETMTRAMIEGTLKAFTQPENIERLAVFSRRYYEALIKQGFTKDEALQIVAGAGIPGVKAGR